MTLQNHSPTLQEAKKCSPSPVGPLSPPFVPIIPLRSPARGWRPSESIPRYGGHGAAKPQPNPKLETNSDGRKPNDQNDQAQRILRPVTHRNLGEVSSNPVLVIQREDKKLLKFLKEE